jgi:hypothetical protein
VVIWYILWLFGTFIPVLVYFSNKNLATLHGRREVVNKCHCSVLRLADRATSFEIFSHWAVVYFGHFLYLFER